MQAQMPENPGVVREGQYLTFYLGGKAFGVDILKVQEIRGWEPVRELPDSPPYLKGVLDLRGTIVPIVDLRSRFGDAEPVYEPTTVVIIVSVENADQGRQLIGMVVDGVSDVLDTARVEVKDPPPSAAGVGSQYLIGMVSLKDEMVVLVNVDAILAEQVPGGAY